MTAPPYSRLPKSLPVVIPGRREAADPESRSIHRLLNWIPGSLAALAPRNDGPGLASLRNLQPLPLQPHNQLPGELRKRIVARAHDDDAIAAAGRPHQGIAAAAAVGKEQGVAPA